MSNNGPKTWSVSAAQRLEQCLLAFKYQYVDRIPRPATEVPLHWRRGTVVHAGLEAAFKQRRAERGVGPMMTDSVWSAAKAGIEKSWHEEEMPEPDDSDGMWDDAIGMVAKTLEDQSVDWEMIFDVEHKLFLRKGMNIIGYADLMLWIEHGRVIRIRDWKTTSKKTLPVDLERNFQGRLYGGMVYELYPEIKQVQFSHYYPPIAEEVVVEISREAGATAISRLRSARDVAHHETEWAPEKGSWCTSCSYQSICPAWAKDPESQALIDQVNLF